MPAGPGNPAPGVGGTAKDGGLSTADTVADGGPDGKESDASYGGDDGKESDASYGGDDGSKQDRNAGPGNPAPGVGGTAKDGGLSTEATVADGGPDDAESDPTYKPS